ncbi:MAG: biotin/lipoyl-binding protein [Ruthenibacterium lactatiformans]
MGKAGLWFKRLWKRLRWFRFTKKRVLLVSAVLAAAALGFGVWRFLRPAGGALPAMADAVRTTRLEKTTLSESITVTGTVESGSVANVTTSLSYPVKEIFVQVGDTVSEGDVICTLDSSDLEEQLANGRRRWPKAGKRRRKITIRPWKATTARRRSRPRRTTPTPVRLRRWKRRATPNI